jgi:AbrB family looped-hinge helix DNA binding protein
MKATGIVRRIDDLGRVVIPKEIRRTMRIREGDPLEIYTDKEGGVIFKKYSQMSDLSDFAGQICETLSKTTGFAAVMTTGLYHCRIRYPEEGAAGPARLSGAGGHYGAAQHLPVQRRHGEKPRL